MKSFDLFMNPCDTEGSFEHLDVKQGVYSVNSYFLIVSSVHLGGSLVHLTTSFVHLTESSDRLIDDPDILSELQEIAKPVSSTGKASKELIEETIIRLCEGRYLTIDELATLLNRNKNSLRSRHISQMIADGRLIQKYRNVPSHPNQKYTTASGGEE